MKKIITALLIITGIALVIYQLTIKSDKSRLETLAIVTKPEQTADIFVFFGQRQEVGSFQKEDNKIYLFVDRSSPAIFFLKDTVSTCIIETYRRRGDKLEKVEYASEMTVKGSDDESFQVIGGTYRNINTPLYEHGNRPLNFITFQAGTAKKIKNNLSIADSIVEDAYKRGLNLKH